MKTYDKHCTNCICNIVLKSDITEMETTEHRVMSDKNNIIRVISYFQKENNSNSYPQYIYSCE